MNSAWESVLSHYSNYKEHIQVSLGTYYPDFLVISNKVKETFSYIIETWPINGEWTLCAIALFLIAWWSYKIGKGHSINVDEYISKIELNKTYEKSLKDTQKRYQTIHSRISTAQKVLYMSVR